MTGLLHHTISMLVPCPGRAIAVWEQIPSSETSLYSATRNLVLQSQVSGGTGFTNSSDDLLALFTTEFMDQYIIAAAFLVVLLIFSYYLNRRRVSQSNRGRLSFSGPGLAVPGVEEDTSIVVNRHHETAVFTPTVFSTDSSPAVLVIATDHEMRLFLTNTLKLNYRVIAVSDGNKGLHKALEMIPDLVITDAEVAGLSGEEIADALGADSATSHIPVIVLTEKSVNDDSPLEVHVRKPFDARSILIMVRNLIDRQKQLLRAFRQSTDSAQWLSELPAAEAAFVNKAFSVLDSKHTDPGLTVDQFAAEIGFTRIQLFRKLKVLTGKSPGEFIRQFRVERAKALLADERMDLAEIAQRTGFNSPAALSKAFRDATGVLPSEYAAIQN